MNRYMGVLAVSSLLMMIPFAHAQDTEKTKAPEKTKAKATAKAEKDTTTTASAASAFSQTNFDFLLSENIAKGQKDTPELRASIKDELINRDLVSKAAKQKGLDKDAKIKAQMDLSAQNVLVRAYIADYIKDHPVPDQELKKDYEAIKSQMGDKQYKVRHILVDKEDDAKEIIAELQKGEKFDKLASRSKDSGSKDKGGDLDWHVPTDFVKPFSDAMVSLDKGKFTATPVKTDFGWHVIELDDVRPAQIPPFEEVKAGLQQRAQGKVIDQMLADLHGKPAAK